MSFDKEKYWANRKNGFNGQLGEPKDPIFLESWVKPIVRKSMRLEERTITPVKSEGFNRLTRRRMARGDI